MGEGCQGSSVNSEQAAYRGGGVSVDGMSGSDTEVSQEISSGARETEQPTVQAATAQTGSGKAVWARGEVGVSRSSVDGTDSITVPEPRGGTYVQADQSDEGLGDGWEDLLSEWTQIVTPEKGSEVAADALSKGKG